MYSVEKVSSSEFLVRLCQVLHLYICVDASRGRMRDHQTKSIGLGVKNVDPKNKKR